MRIRDYQLRGVDAAFEQWKEVLSTLISMPTGTGKTRIAAEVIQRIQPKRTMFVAHARELLFQAKETILNSCFLESELEMAELRAGNTLFSAPVVLAMVQSLNSKNSDGIRRLRRFYPKDFGLLVIDEAHHGVTDSYKQVIDHFKQNPELRILALTATADRLDEEALGQICDSVAMDYEILDAIHDGWLVEPYQHFVGIEGLDLTRVSSHDGDFNQVELAQEMEAQRTLYGVADSTLKVVGDKRTLIFTASVKQAEWLSTILNNHKPGCSGWVCGETGSEQRKAMLADFNSGRLQVMCNCNCLSEGFDSPMVEVVVHAAPTKSRARYAQRCGRSLRPEPGLVDNYSTSAARRKAISKSSKPFATILDFVGVSGKHKLMSVADLLGGNVSEQAIQNVVEKAKSSGRAVQLTEELVAEEERLQKEAREWRMIQEAKRVRMIGNSTFSLKTISPFDAFDLSPMKERGWDVGRAASDKERDFFLKHHIDVNGMTKPQRDQLRRTMIYRWRRNLATLKQCARIKQYYPAQDTTRLTKDGASRILDELALNNWRPMQKEVTT